MRRYALVLMVFAVLLALTCCCSSRIIGPREPLSPTSGNTPHPILVQSPTPRQMVIVTPGPRVTPTSPSKPIILLYTEGRVVKVIDGDTIDVMIDGRVSRVRYIGIDCPEIHHPQKGLEPFGPEAKERNAELVADRTVRLEKDVSETDRYGRLLRYVWVGDVMVNEVLVKEGYAYSKHYPPDVKHQKRLDDLQREAQENKRGLWGMPPESSK